MENDVVQNMNNILPEKEHKAEYVKNMFADIAPSYDQANRAMTFGMDVLWRQRLIKLVAPPSGGYILDVGTGTGDFLALLASQVPASMVVGVDSCIPMMSKGQEKIDQVCQQQSGTTAHTSQQSAMCRVQFAGGDALNLPFADNSFDVLTTGFTIRNVTNIRAALREMWRVTKPGGAMACLEVARPKSAVLHVFHQLYFQHIVPRIGELISGNRHAYVYLHQSARAFPPPDMLADLMYEAGWRSVRYTLLSLGAVAIHVGEKT